MITQGGSGGILFSGDPTGGTLASVAIGRLINNTIVGNPASPIGVGIQVEENASPTILNNILADLAVHISVDAGSQALGTVLGGTLYRAPNSCTNGVGGPAVNCAETIILASQGTGFTVSAGGSATNGFFSVSVIKP